MSASDMFPEAYESSPRLKWMQEHRVSVRCNMDVPVESGRYEAWNGEFMSAIEDVAQNGEASKRMGYGFGEVQAMLDLARKNGWEGW